MPESGNGVRDHFIKQRRTLVLISLFIIFYRVGDLKVEEISFLGNKTTVGNPAIVGFALSLFFLYFLYRYYTACRDECGVLKFIKSTRRWADLKMFQKVTGLVAQKYEARFGEPRIDYRRWRAITYKCHVVTGTNDYGAQETEDIEIVLGHDVLFWRLFSPIYGTINYGDFSEYILPYILAAIVIADFLGAGLVERFIGLFGFSL